jgi:hypothetical protein
MKDEKLKYHLKHIESKYPGQSKLNLGQMLDCINMSRSTFKRRSDANRFDLLPTFKSQSHDRTVNQYNTYQFDVYDIAEFLAKC